MIEVRSVKGSMFGVGTPTNDPNAWINGHYRRFIVKQDLLEELEFIGFKIVFETEGDNLSVCGDDNPVLIRVIARK